MLTRALASLAISRDGGHRWTLINASPDLPRRSRIIGISIRAAASAPARLRQWCSLADRPDRRRALAGVSARHSRRGVDHAGAWGLSVIVQPIRQGQFLHARHDRACSKARAARKPRRVRRECRRESEVLSGDNGTAHPCEFRPPSPPDHGRVTDDTPGLSLVHRQ